MKPPPAEDNNLWEAYRIGSNPTVHVGELVSVIVPGPPITTPTGRQKKETNEATPSLAANLTLHNFSTTSPQLLHNFSITSPYAIEYLEKL
jgi:hypothetical protein